MYKIFHKENNNSNRKMKGIRIMKSYWTEEFDDKINFPEVKEDLETDVCIIGGGLTGLSCGYYLSKEMKIIVLERDEICSSTSGKNTGKLTSQHGLFYKYLIDANGEKFAKKYFEANEKAIDNIEKIGLTETTFTETLADLSAFSIMGKSVWL